MIKIKHAHIEFEYIALHSLFTQFTVARIRFKLLSNFYIPGGQNYPSSTTGKVTNHYTSSSLHLNFMLQNYVKWQFATERNLKSIAKFSLDIYIEHIIKYES